MIRSFSLALCIFFLGCSHAPETGRTQLIMLSSSQEIALGHEAFAEVLKKEKIVSSGEEYEMVQEVGEKVALAASRLYPNAVRGYKWRFALIKDKDMVNAWALPGGKCAVYTGLLPIAKNKDGLAIVMAHEVAHVIARHGAERASHSMVGAAVVAGMAMADMNKRDRSVVLGAYGLGVALPFSRTQETEADQLGLYIAADAGFDPRQAIPLWKRMGTENKGAPPEFMSTHPSSKTRIQQLRRWMPKAMLYYDTAIAHEDALQTNNKPKN